MRRTRSAGIDRPRWTASGPGVREVGPSFRRVLRWCGAGGDAPTLVVLLIRAGPLLAFSAPSGASRGRMGRLVRRSLRRSYGEADLPGPLVSQLEGLPHIKAQRAQSPGQVLERPQHRSLHLDGGPLSELVVTQVRLQGLGDRCWQAPMGLLPDARQGRVSRLRLRQPRPFWPRSIPKQDPFQRDASNPAIPRPHDDQARGLRRKVLALGPLLYGGCGDRLPEFGGELPIGQRDALPGAKNPQQDGESLPYGANFRSVSGLDRFQCDSRLAT